MIFLSNSDLNKRLKVKASMRKLAFAYSTLIYFARIIGLSNVHKISSPKANVTCHSPENPQLRDSRSLGTQTKIGLEPQW
jgi:hypothetical protein